MTRSRFELIKSVRPGARRWRAFRMPGTIRYNDNKIFKHGKIVTTTSQLEVPSELPPP
jgi:hypothetical protein